jgi:hypothetical protein
LVLAASSPLHPQVPINVEKIPPQGQDYSKAQSPDFHVCPVANGNSMARQAGSPGERPKNPVATVACKPLMTTQSTIEKYSLRPDDELLGIVIEACWS